MDSFVSEVFELPCAKKFHLKRKKTSFEVVLNLISYLTS